MSTSLSATRRARFGRCMGTRPPSRASMGGFGRTYRRHPAMPGSTPLTAGMAGFAIVAACIVCRTASGTISRRWVRLHGFLGAFPDDAVDPAFGILSASLTPDRSIQKTVLLVGEVGNGRRVFLALVLNFVGRRNVSAGSSQPAMAQHREAPETVSRKRERRRGQV